MLQKVAFGLWFSPGVLRVFKTRGGHCFSLRCLVVRTRSWRCARKNEIRYSCIELIQLLHAVKFQNRLSVSFTLTAIVWLNCSIDGRWDIRCSDASWGLERPASSSKFGFALPVSVFWGWQHPPRRTELSCVCGARHPCIWEHHAQKLGCAIYPEKNEGYPWIVSLHPQILGCPVCFWLRV